MHKRNRLDLLPMLSPQESPSIVPQTPAWDYIRGSSQEMALAAKRAHHILFTGARGPGKTDTQLMAFRRRVGFGYGPFWRGIILDREYKNLDDLISKSKRWFYNCNDGARFLSSNSDLKWVWPTGEELLFRQIKKKDDYWNYHGQEFPFIGWNELCKYATSELYDMMMSCNRSSFTPEKDTPMSGRLITNDGEIVYDRSIGKLCDPIPLRVFSTSNPYGPGHNWVKRRFISPSPYGTPVEIRTEVFNPKTKQNEEIVKYQVAIFGSYKENIYLSPEYIAELERQTDPNLRKAWLTGSWDIVAGGALDDVWKAGIHVLPRFVIPETWRVDRALDWGSTHPFAVGWFAEANGETAILPDGTTFCPPPGTLIQFNEWYGTKEIGTNKGIKLSAKDVAKGIIERETFMLSRGWIHKQPSPGPADNQIRDVREIDVDTIETKMAKEGVRWVESDKSPGSRRNGLQLIRDRLEASIRGEGPGLYFTNNNRATIELIPTMARDPDNMDDVDTDSEDHLYDMVRYRVARSSNRIATHIPVSWPV